MPARVTFKAGDWPHRVDVPPALARYDAGDRVADDVQASTATRRAL